MQGRSLVPLLRDGPDGVEARLAFSERVPLGVPIDPAASLDALAVTTERWKLIHNRTRPEGRAEFELFDRRADPSEQTNVADAHPEVIERLLAAIDAWERRMGPNRFRKHETDCVVQGGPAEGAEPPCVRPELIAVSDLDRDGKLEYWHTAPYIWDTGFRVAEEGQADGLLSMISACPGCSD